MRGPTLLPRFRRICALKGLEQEAKGGIQRWKAERVFRALNTSPGQRARKSRLAKVAIPHQ
jgi:hypothetical protein